MIFLLGVMLGVLIGTGVAALMCAAGRDSIDGKWGNSCNGDCNQGRNCNCVKKENNV